MKSLREFKYLMKLISEEKGKLIFASIIIFLCSITSIFTGYLNGAAVEAITKSNIEMALIFLVIYFCINVIFEGVIRAKGIALLQKVESKLTRKMGYSSYEKTLNLPAYAFEKHSSGEIINRITNDADSLSFTFERLIKIFASFVSCAIIYVYILFNSWIIALEILIIVLILFFIVKKYNPVLKQLHKERKEEQDKFTSLVNESVRGIREIKTLGIKDNLLSNTREIIKMIFNKSTREIDVNNKYNISMMITKSILEVGVFVTCVILMYYNMVSLTFFIAMTYYVYRYMWLIENINEFTQNYQKLAVSMERVNDLLENRLFHDEEFGDKEIKNAKGYIEFKNVSFAYPNESKTLDNFNVTFEPHKKIAIVGKSGQGKSTLFNLLTRVFDASEGEILIDGINIKDLTEKSLRNNVSIIRQEPFIFNRTIKENFQIVDSKISLKEIRKYTKMACIDDYIMSLPKKYNTILGEGGVNLSGGQKQRLAIARTLSKKCQIILFDEATSALDNESQEYIKQAIDNIIHDHTIIIVAHRLSTIMDADVIHVVDKGMVTASGKHDDLLKNNKIYQKLYETEL